MNANTDSIESRLGILLGRVRRLPAIPARAWRALKRRIAAADPPFHSRMGSWETKVSPGARAAVLAMRRRRELEEPDVVQ